MLWDQSRVCACAAPVKTKDRIDTEISLAVDFFMASSLKAITLVLPHILRLIRLAS